MTALSPIQSSVTQFGCHQSQPANVKAQFGHACNGLGCCAKFSAQARTNSCDSTGCSAGPTVLAVLGAIGLAIVGLLVGKRVIKTVFGTAATTFREFFSRLFTGKGVIETARSKGQVQGYVQGAKDGMTVSKNYFIREIWNPFVAHLRYGVDVTAAKINAR